LREIWFKVFRGDYVKLIQFYEDTYSDREVQRHESLIEMFLVALASTVVGGVITEEYRSRRKKILQNLKRIEKRSRLALSYLLNLYALKYMLASGRITPTGYKKISTSMKRRLELGKEMGPEIDRLLRPFFNQHGLDSAEEIVSPDNLNKARLHTKDKPLIAAKPRIAPEIKRKMVVLTGLAASPGIAVGLCKLVRSVHDCLKVQGGDVGVFHLTSPEMLSAITRCAGVIGTSDAGGMTGHLSVIARGMGIPAVVGLDEDEPNLNDGHLSIVDGTSGKIYLLPVAMRALKTKEVSR
jgi:phosphohistidine swiveling domain-containing protein